jgi:hypothetical protein
MSMGCSPHGQNSGMTDDGNMSTHPSRIERLVLFAADNEGRIPFPKCKKSDLRIIRRALAQLKKRGFVQEEERPHSNGSPYVLTDAGINCRKYMISGIIQNEVDSMSWSREEPDPHLSGLL